MARRVFWSPWYTSHWLIRRHIRREMVRRHVVVVVPSSVPIHEVCFTFISFYLID